MAKKQRPTEEEAVPGGYSDEPIEALKLLISCVVMLEATADWVDSHATFLARWGGVEATNALQNMAGMVTSLVEQYHTGLEQMEVIPAPGIFWKAVKRVEDIDPPGDDLPF